MLGLSLIRGDPVVLQDGCRRGTLTVYVPGLDSVEPVSRFHVIYMNTQSVNFVTSNVRRTVADFSHAPPERVFTKP
ncbi:hypothetical protein Tco_0881597 [Tanacetum coccineum]